MFPIHLSYQNTDVNILTKNTNCITFCSLSYGQVHSSFQNQFYTQCDLVLPVYICSMLSFPKCHTVDAYIFFIVFPSLLSFPLPFLQWRVLEDSSFPISDQSRQPSLFLLFVGYYTLPWIFMALLNFSHDRPNWSSSSFHSTAFQNFLRISHPLFPVSNFQTHTELWSKCSNLLVSSLNLSPICWWIESSWLMLLLSWQSWI